MKKSKYQKILLVGGCGYIGSYLYSMLLKEGSDVCVCDMQLRGNPLNISLIDNDYSNLSKSDLQAFDIILWFAGHSSVAQSIKDPEGALQNNCLQLYEFVKRLSSGTKFIYASSASLYSSDDRSPEEASEESLVKIPMNNPYDISKFAFDYLLQSFLPKCKFYGLRMGTLSGNSPNLRPELVFNAMSISASTKGVVNLQNGSSWRTILFLEDLWILVRSIILKNPAPGFINVGSHSVTLADLASEIGTAWGASINDCGNSKTYSFRLSSDKMNTICKDGILMESIGIKSKNFINSLLNAS